MMERERGRERERERERERNIFIRLSTCGIFTQRYIVRIVDGI
jgi:hypothetical protein